jgi:IclR family acetate operon transcriptional repressor
MPETQTVRVVGRAIDIVDCLCANGAPMAIVDMCDQTKLAKSTVHRLLTVLVAYDLVKQDPTTHRYSLGLKTMQWGLAYTEQLELRKIALPYMQRLRHQTNETVTLSLRVGDERVYVEELESAQPIRLRVMEMPGEPLSLCEGGSGKAILAFLPEDQQERILREPHKAVYTDRTLTDYEDLRSEIRKIRGQGYATSLGERVEGAASVAAAIRDDTGYAFAAIAISGPSDRFPPQIVAEYAQLVKEAAGRISLEFGYADSG